MNKTGQKAHDDGKGVTETKLVINATLSHSLQEVRKNIKVIHDYTTQGF